MSVQFRIFCVVSVLTLGCQDQAALLPADSPGHSFSEQAVTSSGDSSDDPSTDGVTESAVAQTQESTQTAERAEQEPLAPLTWLQTGIVDAGYELSLGYRAETIVPDGLLEPVVIVQQNGDVVADSRLIVCLLSADGEVLLESEPAVTMEESAAHAAHQTVKGVRLPEEVADLTLRYRIQLPGSETESWYDVRLTASSP
ncbi:MAG: hypothetical protein NXI04_00180 [Planctomycetaceae bacterium]|nr:hypothetical protein [Planctomycetaceae bacterium]